MKVFTGLGRHQRAEVEEGKGGACASLSGSGIYLDPDDPVRIYVRKKANKEHLNRLKHIGKGEAPGNVLVLLQPDKEIEGL